MADSLLATALLEAPVTTRLALAAPSPRLREQAAHELSDLILHALEHPPTYQDRRQLALPL